MSNNERPEELIVAGAQQAEESQGTSHDLEGLHRTSSEENNNNGESTTGLSHFPRLAPVTRPARDLRSAPRTRARNIPGELPLLWDLPEPVSIIARTTPPGHRVRLSRIPRAQRAPPSVIEHAQILLLDPPDIVSDSILRVLENAATGFPSHFGMTSAEIAAARNEARVLSTTLNTPLDTINTIMNWREEELNTGRPHPRDPLDPNRATVAWQVDDMPAAPGQPDVQIRRLDLAVSTEELLSTSTGVVGGMEDREEGDRPRFNSLLPIFHDVTERLGEDSRVRIAEIAELGHEVRALRAQATELGEEHTKGQRRPENTVQGVDPDAEYGERRLRRHQAFNEDALLVFPELRSIAEFGADASSHSLPTSLTVGTIDALQGRRTQARANFHNRSPRRRDYRSDAEIIQADEDAEDEAELGGYEIGQNDLQGFGTSVDLDAMLEAQEELREEHRLWGPRVDWWHE
ncbi:hypothetical protein B0A55_04991 [Friedmanniomyces simplex]|uniref:Uncharacterized protein n=1 Tax=Friedmanniomyces simplex TaxID=329884 RepID=A0A4U0XJT0_9PEZI|nr:hypothetical protein B0A55_04991 [Friedmanniomyces simplex]